MLLVDSSVWIDYFNGTPSAEAQRLDGLLGRQDLLTGDLILAEVLSGFDRAADFRRARRLMATLAYEDMLGQAVALRGAAYYRALRRRGITVRKTIDVLIASFCILRGHSLLHRDRDFEPFQRLFGLAKA
ncbi:MAG: PIN domain nuclease [Betaproteobacteria bacterium]|nr:MAG: PIN domain nuclease [Betaproteobacteria bacterium]